MCDFLVCSPLRSTVFFLEFFFLLLFLFFFGQVEFLFIENKRKTKTKNKCTKMRTHKIHKCDLFSLFFFSLCNYMLKTMDSLSLGFFSLTMHNSSFNFIVVDSRPKTNNNNNTDRNVCCFLFAHFTSLRFIVTVFQLLYVLRPA